MNTADKIRNFIKSIAMREIGELKNDTELFDSGILDSFGLLEVVSFIEIEYGVKIEDYEVINAGADTIEKLAEFIKGRI